MVQRQRVHSSKLNQIGIESSIYLASVKGVEHQKPYYTHAFGTRRPANKKNKYGLTRLKTTNVLDAST